MTDPEKPRRKGWRYQPVFTEQGEERTYTLVEAYFNAADALESWTEDPAMIPQGETVEELCRDLVRMLAAVWKWVPVNYNDLHGGMKFERTGVDVESVLRAMNEAGTP